MKNPLLMEGLGGRKPGLPPGRERNHSRLRGLIFAWLSILVVGGQLATAPPGLAAFPGQNGRIVFLWDGLYTMNPDGSGLIRLTNSSQDYFPKWSPDGGKIAFSSERAGPVAHVYTMNSDGSGLTDLTPSGYGEAPTWSPDGTKIAFGQFSGGIWVMNSDGSGLTQLTSGDDAWPAWSPDGTTVAFARFESTWRIWTMNSDGSGQVQLTDGPGDLYSDWSPDGTKIVFQRGDIEPQIYSMNPDGSGLTPLTDSGSSGPTWAPDGTKIGFTKDSAPGFWVMNPDGSGQIRLSTGSVVFPNWQPLQVSLSVSATKVVYKHSVTVTGHLFWYQTSPNQTISIYKTPYGGTKTLVASGVVDANGNLSAAVVMYKKTVFTAEWSGDSDHPAGGVSNPVTVYVYSIVRGKLSGYYGTSGKYRLYHYTSNCPNFYKGCPTYTATVVPNHHGKYVYFTLQGYLSGAWRTVDSFRLRLNSQSKRTVIFVYGNRKIIGIRWRVRAQFKGDVDHLGRTSPWSYFKVTS